jgi:hypothetical protein
MKNCLIVAVALVGCFCVAAYFAIFMDHSSSNRSANHMIATWHTYGIEPGFDVSVGTDRMDVDELVPGVAKRQEIRGHWTAHAFYVDSTLDTSTQTAVAHEMKDEDLEVNLGYFKPGLPDKVTCVMLHRTFPQDSPFPIEGEVKPVTYPPPRGLIRVGMLECDLQTLPWHADHIENTGVVIHAPYEDHLSDGTVNTVRYNDQGDDDRNPPTYYSYHSDRPGVPKLVVQVYRGRVVEVAGGAEEASDIPYRLVTRERPDNSDAPEKTPRTWDDWLFHLIFGK